MRRCSLVLIAFIILLPAYARQNDFNFINFNSKNGLSSNSVTAIFKDRNGYMWFATEDGLNKFDGINFTVYRHKEGDSTSIGANTIGALCEDRQGNFWVAAGNLLSQYNRKKDAFINYHLSDGVIRSLCLDHSGNIWIATYDGLLVFDPVLKKVKRYSADLGNASRLLSNIVLCVFEDSQRRIWIGTNEGLNLYVNATDNFIRFRPVENDPASLPDKIVRAIAEDKQGNIWFGTKEGGLCMLQHNGKSFIHFKHKKEDLSTISGNRIYALSIDNENKLWVGSEDGLDIFDPQTGLAFRVGYDQRKRYSFIGKSIRSIYIDNTGIYWVGTFRAGINKYDKNLAFFNLRQSNPFDPFGLRSSTVTSFVERPDGDLYMGTDGGGLHVFHRNTGLFDHPVLLPGARDKVQTILAMELVGDELWIGTYPDGVYVWNTITHKVRHYVKGKGNKDITNNEIFCIKKDRRGKVWIGTNGNGVCVYDPLSLTFSRFDPRDPETGKNIAPSNGFIRSIVEDVQGNMWIASFGSGIGIYNPAKGTFRSLTQANSKLPYDFITHLFVAGNGTVWVGTAGKGLGRYDYSTNSFLSYSESDGLINGFVYSILEDDAGKLWISTNKGISSFDPASGKFKNYSYHNGLQQSSYFGGAALRTSKGDMFFGGLDGFNYFNPPSFRSNTSIPSLVLTDLKVANRSVMPDEHAAIKEHISIAREIRLDYSQNFSIDYAALNYTAPEETRFAYKLDGFDKGWNEVGAVKTAVYTNLAPGKYTFRLKAKSEDGAWFSPETAIDVYVKPPIWRTTYAYIFYCLLAFSLVWGIRYISIRRLEYKFAMEKERQQFEQMLDEKRKEAERERKFDQVKIKFLTNLSHEFRTPISLIVSPAEQLLEQEANDMRREQLGLIKRNARRLLNLVNQLLDFRKLEESELKLNATENDLVAFAKDVGDSFIDIARRKGIDFSFSSSLPQYYTTFDKDKVERILFNLLSNAFKFTKEGKKITLTLEPGSTTGVRIIVADTGIGIDQLTQGKLFERFTQGNTAKAILNQGTGLGLSITREFVEMHGGTITVESKPGEGSTFTVYLPCTPIARIIDAGNLPAGTLPEPHLPVSDLAGEVNKPVVLLIDDHEDFLTYLCSNLKQAYKIVKASDGKEGWKKTLATHPQVIVSDINMPKMDGISLCRKIRADKRTQHIPVILLTALTGDANLLKGLDSGANDYLAKPFNFEILNAKIKSLLTLNQSLKSVYRRQLKVVGPDIEVESENEKLLHSVVEFIEANIDSPNLSVKELRKHTCMSKGSLYNKIVALTGETPVEFIRSVKLEKAAALLEKSDMKVAQVGYAVGFTTPNYFARAFKAKFNISPSEYARLKRNAG